MIRVSTPVERGYHVYVAIAAAVMAVVALPAIGFAIPIAAGSAANVLQFRRKRGRMVPRIEISDDAVTILTVAPPVCVPMAMIARVSAKLVHGLQYPYALWVEDAAGRGTPLFDGAKVQIEHAAKLIAARMPRQ